MARDLANEVEKFFRHQNAYIRKKAALCAIRIIRKVPELIEEFQNSVTNLLNDKNHAVLLTAVCLIIEMIKLDEKLIASTFRKLVPTIVRLLKNLVLAGYVSEYDVVGITDPFLQCKLIHLLRLLGTGDREASDFMGDILAQIAINCFPAADHQVLTRHGYMYLTDVQRHFETSTHLDVACFVDGHVEYHAITADKVITATGEHTFVEMGSEDAQLSIKPTANHRMWGRFGGEKMDEAAPFRIQSAGQVLHHGEANPNSTFQFNAAFEHGIAPRAEFVVPFNIPSNDFLQLYGLWLRCGSVSEFGVHFNTAIAADVLSRAGIDFIHTDANLITLISSEWISYFQSLLPSSLAPFMLESLNRQQLRLVIQQLSLDGASIQSVSSIELRDGLMQALLHAGYSAYFEAQHRAGELTEWKITFTEDERVAMPTINIAKSCVKSRETGTIWCVSVPTADQLIMVRRVLESEKTANGEVIMSASRPLVVGNTESNKNPGNAILYECVMAIMSIEAEGGLRVLAINILGRFLTNRDNNIRYVALNVLCKCVNRDTAAVQRHRNTVVDNLKDADISIRRRALDLIYALVTKNNVKALVKELLNYLALTSGDLEFKADLTEKICLVVERFAPSKHWHIDTIIQVLQTAGNFTRESVATDLILLIARTPNLHAYSVFKLFYALYKKYKHAQLPLIHVVVWCVGEFGDMLTTEAGYQAAYKIENANPADTANGLEPGTSETTVVSEAMVLDLLHKVMKSPIAQNVTKQYVLNALVKLTGRFSQDGPERERLKSYISQYSTSMNMELQQRSCEYSVLVGESLAKIRNGVVGRMPVPTKKAKKEGDETKDSKKDDEEESSESEEEESESEEEDEKPSSAAKPASNGVKKAGPAAAAPAAAAPVVDIFGDLLGNASSSPAPAPSATKANAPATDLLDLFGGGSVTSAPTPAAAPANTGFDLFGGSLAPTPAQPASNNSLSTMGDLFGSLPSAPSPSQANSGLQTFPSERVFDSKGLSITFSYSRQSSSPELLNVTASFSNSTSADFTNFDFQVAVLKNVILTMSPATSTVIPAGSNGQVTQQLKLNNTLHGKKKLLIRVKIDYKVNGVAQTEVAQINQFPE